MQKFTASLFLLCLISTLARFWVKDRRARPNVCWVRAGESYFLSPKAKSKGDKKRLQQRARPNAKFHKVIRLLKTPASASTRFWCPHQHHTVLNLMTLPGRPNIYLLRIHQARIRSIKSICARSYAIKASIAIIFPRVFPAANPRKSVPVWLFVIVCHADIIAGRV